MPLLIAGWVLAGGKSSRMGTNKALLWNEAKMPFLQHAASVLQSISQTVQIIGDPAIYHPLGFAAIPDLRPYCGPLAGIEAALSATTEDWNAFLACDLPGVRATVFEALRDLLDPAADVILPQHPDGRTEPLCAIYHRRTLPAIQAALDSGNRKVTDVLRPLTLRYLPVADPSIFQNLNTPADLEFYLESRRA